MVDPFEILKVGKLDHDLAFARPHRDAHTCGQVLGKQLLQLEQTGRTQPRGAGQAGAIANPARRLLARWPSGSVRRHHDRARPPRACAPTSSRQRPGGPVAPGTLGRACPATPWRGRPTADHRPAAPESPAGSDSRRRVLVTAERLLPTRDATCSWVSEKSSIELLVGRGLFQRRQILAMEVLHQRPLDRAEIVGGAHDRRNDGQAGTPGRAPAALAGDQFVGAVLGDRAHQHRLQHADLAHRGGELGQ